jgi:hypothetical protein
VATLCGSLQVRPGDTPAGGDGVVGFAVVLGPGSAAAGGPGRRPVRDNRVRPAAHPLGTQLAVPAGDDGGRSARRGWRSLVRPDRGHRHQWHHVVNHGAGRVAVAATLPCATTARLGTGRGPAGRERLIWFTPFGGKVTERTSRATPSLAADSAVGGGPHPPYGSHIPGIFGHYPLPLPHRLRPVRRARLGRARQTRTVSRSPPARAPPGGRVHPATDGDELGLYASFIRPVEKGEWRLDVGESAGFCTAYGVDLVASLKDAWLVEQGSDRRPACAARYRAPARRWAGACGRAAGPVG